MSEWDDYAAAMRHWRLTGNGPKPRTALQHGRHIDTLPVEVNAPPSHVKMPVLLAEPQMAKALSMMEHLQKTMDPDLLKHALEPLR